MSSTESSSSSSQGLQHSYAAAASRESGSQQLQRSQRLHSSSQQIQLPNIAGLTLSETGSSQVVLAVLLRHPCVMQDQQLVAKLLQTSQDVRVQVVQWGLRQLQVILQPRNMQEVECFTQWLQKHGSLVCGIAAELTRKHSPHCMGSCSSDCSKERAWAATAVSALAAAIQQAAAAAAGALQLQSLSLTGSTADAALLL
uniref:Uncharacterized protein n=1 Tax=Tetradesmus obliquus TaxID=3088 RepID=A0A383V7Z0_TETOB|eukprot:jgi/Sobl393_1/3040/SZX61060.1